MKPSSRLAASVLFLLFAFASAPFPAHAAEDPADAIGKELQTVLRELDILSSELDRIGEISTVPKATLLRLEIRKGGEVPAPTSVKVFLSGKTAVDRELTAAEKERFLAGVEPVVLNVPILPGAYEGRLLLSHKSWKIPPSHDFRPSVKAGETFRLRLSVSASREKKAPVLAVSPEQ